MPAPETRSPRAPRRFRGAAALLAALALQAPPQAARAAEIGPVLYDSVIVRPLAAVHTLAGLIVFVPVAVLALPSRNVGEAWQTFVLHPANDLLRRPLGEF